MTAPLAAFCDADVLVPIVCCDFLLTAAEAGLVDVVVSEPVLAEVERNLIGHFPHLDPMRLHRRVQTQNRASEGPDRTVQVSPKTTSDLRKHLEAAPGIEPGYRDLQSLAFSANPLVSTAKVPRGGSLGAERGQQSRTAAGINGHDRVVSDAESPLWVGLVDASFDDGPTEDGMVGAFMWVICRAESVEDFERRVTDELASHEATPTEFNDVELVAQRSRLSRDLRRLVHDARSGDVALGTWHRYREGDE